MVEQKKRFEPIGSRVSFPAVEEEVLRQWREHDTMHEVDRARADAPLFVFYEGPPTANGSPGIHHVLSRSFKDIILRYKTMRGFRVLRRGGWDTHGLPVELEVEKELGLSSKREIDAYGIEEFNRRCRESVFRYVKDWEEMTERAGVWLDMRDAYVTYHNSYIESAWWVFKRLWDQGLMYEGHKVTPHCPRCVTSLSSHEVALGYQEDTPDPSVFVRFPLSTAQEGGAPALPKLGYGERGWEAGPPALAVWTTTPWTLTANTAVAVAPDETYVLVEKGRSAGEQEQVEAPERLLLAASLVGRVLGEGWTELARLEGIDLVGLTYEPPFAPPELAELPHRVYPAGYVTTADGTGLVHIAPAFGAEDAELARAHGLPTVHTVDLRGALLEGFPGAGKFVKEADRDLIRDLRQRGLLIKDGVYRHTYPFCWRCGTPLLYYAKASWYIRTTAVKEQMVAGNQTVNWFPEHIKEGRFGEWLRNNIDWAVSRERYWGTPLPIWRCGSCGETDCMGGTKELAERATAATRHLVDGLDLHRPYVDRVELACQKCGGAMQRVPEVADAWYDSGAMPFAQWDYPVELQQPGGGKLTLAGVEDTIASPYFPADFITEAVDQTRGWFYSLLALSTLITGRPPYRNVICLGLILDAKGEKMSKSKGNVVNPWDVMKHQGADALRWYLYTAAPAGAARRFSPDLVQETLRRFMLTLWNTYSFFVTYANIDGFDPDAHAGHWIGDVGGPSLRRTPPNELDRWVISELNELVRDVTAHLEGYTPTEAGRRIEDFVDLLSNWYVRRSRRRFWRAASPRRGGPADRPLSTTSTAGDEDKTWAYVTLYSCLLTLSKLMAPMTPFLADAMFRNLAPEGSPGSVHLADYPEADTALIDDTLDRAVRLAMRVASLGRAARGKGRLKVRQPLARVIVRPRADEAGLLPMVRDQVQDELNVKRVELADEGELAFRLRPNLPVLGPKYGQRLGALRAALDQADAADVVAQLRGGSAKVGEFTLEPEEVLIDVEERPGLAVAMEGAARLIVGMDTRLTPELEAEGMARELAHRIQNVRKAAGLDIEDRIVTWVNADGELAAALDTHGSYVMEETLSVDLRREAPPADVYSETQDVEGVRVTLGVRKAE